MSNFSALLWKINTNQLKTVNTVDNSRCAEKFQTKYNTSNHKHDPSLHCVYWLMRVGQLPKYLTQWTICGRGRPAGAKVQPSTTRDHLIWAFGGVISLLWPKNCFGQSILHRYYYNACNLMTCVRLLQLKSIVFDRGPLIIFNS